MMVGYCYIFTYVETLIQCLSVSLVDGYNLPMRIDNNKGCGVADCPVDLGPNCEYATNNLFTRSVY